MRIHEMFKTRLLSEPFHLKAGDEEQAKISTERTDEDQQMANETWLKLSKFNQTYICRTAPIGFPVSWHDPCDKQIVVKDMI
jgi:hypothetical protein